MSYWLHFIQLIISISIVERVYSDQVKHTKTGILTVSCTHKCTKLQTKASLRHKASIKDRDTVRKALVWANMGHPAQTRGLSGPNSYFCEIKVKM